MENRSRRGSVVTQMSAHRLVEMFEVMAELEGMCAAVAQSSSMTCPITRTVPEGGPMDAFVASHRAIEPDARSGIHRFGHASDQIAKFGFDPGAGAKSSVARTGSVVTRTIPISEMMDPST